MADLPAIAADDERLAVFATRSRSLPLRRQPLQRRRPRLWSRRDQRGRRSGVHRPRRAQAADRRARSVSRRPPDPRRARAAARADRRARRDAQARRLSAQSRLYPGRAVLCRRARDRAAQLHRRIAVPRPRRPRRADRRRRAPIESALDLCAGGGSLAILAARVFRQRCGSTRSSFPPTRSRSRAATSRSTISPTG